MLAKFPSTYFVRTVHVRNKISEANVSKKIRIDCVKHRKFFQIFLTCVHCNIGSCISGEFHDGSGGQIL